MVQKLETAAKELQTARTFMLMLQDRVPFIQSKAEGDAAKLLMQTMGVDVLVWVGNEISKFLDDKPVFNAADFNLIHFANRKELEQRLDHLDSVQGWLKDPFMYSSHKELRDSALMGLRKALMTIEGILEYLGASARY